MHNGSVLWLKLVSGMYKPAKSLCIIDCGNDFCREIGFWKCEWVVQRSGVEI
jgi:hypothetical protein